MSLSRRNLPLNAMRAFDVAARHCHLRKAAEELGVTHGAVSRQVKQLEQVLGVALFDRQHNRMTLTSAGMRLQRVVEDALNSITEASVWLDPESMQGSLVIATTPSISVGWLLRVIGDFGRQYTEVEIRLVNIDPLQQELPTEIDIAICYGRPQSGQREVRELFRERYLPVCSPSLIAEQHPLASPQDLMAYPLLHDRHDHWQRWLGQFQLDQQLAIQNTYLQDTFQVICAVREGYGIGFADRLEVDDDLQSGALIAPFDQTIGAEQSHFLATEKPERMTIRSRLFVEHLEAVLKRHKV